MSTTYLITGGAGFIGSYLCESLLQDGHRVFVIDDLSTGSLSNIEPLLGHPNFQFARASITDSLVLDRMACESNVIFHLAAAVGVNLVVEHPVHTIETNVMGTEAVLRAALRYGSRVFVASTSEVYGKSQRIPFREEDDILLGPSSKSRWGYAASKLVDEFLGFAYVREFGLQMTAFRLFNTVGPRQTGRYGMVIPEFVGRALRNQPIRVFGDGSQSRCFCHVRDVVRALRGLVAQPAVTGKVVNIGATDEVTILQLAQLIKKKTKSKSSIVKVPYDEAYASGFEDMLRRVPDITRIGDLIGWKPEASLSTILDDVIAYERNRLKETTPPFATPKAVLAAASLPPALLPETASRK
jgi:UDP-glucose 4-epimerase